MVCHVLFAVAELESILEPLSLRKKALIIMAINDNNSRDSPGGSHWSVSCICSFFSIKQDLAICGQVPTVLSFQESAELFSKR